MEGCPIIRGRRRLKKVIGYFVKRYVELNGL